MRKIAELSAMFPYSSSRQLPVVFCATLLASADRRFIYGRRQNANEPPGSSVSNVAGPRANPVERSGARCVEVDPPRRSLNEVLTSVTHLIEAHSEGMSCGRGGGGRWNGLSRWFTGPYGVFEDGAYGEWLAVRKESVCLIPQGFDDVSAAGIPIAYLTAHMALTLAGFQPGKTVLARAIGGSVGNAVTQLARALGAKHAVSSTTNHE
ncbi:MAG: Quinone oxidoreductase [Candidatus Acidoferrum typicum]|nr:Quinone oxidoreductase [Candidatus Acidoferrum typicum]